MHDHFSSFFDCYFLTDSQKMIVYKLKNDKKIIKKNRPFCDQPFCVLIDDLFIQLSGLYC